MRIDTYLTGQAVASRDRAALDSYVGKTEPLGKRSDRLVLVVRTSHGDRQLWVSPDYADYRGAWEEAFPALSIPQGHHIDHIHNRDRAAKENWGSSA